LGSRRGIDPADFLKQRFAQVTLSCDSARVNGPTARLEGGYRVVYGQLFCGQQRGQDDGVHIFLKISSGDAATYAVSLDVHTPASETSPRRQGSRLFLRPTPPSDKTPRSPPARGRGE
jgi:hypothetical protein